MSQSIIEVNQAGSASGLTIPALYVIVPNKWHYNSTVTGASLVRTFTIALSYYVSAGAYEAGTPQMPTVDGLPTQIIKVFNETEWAAIFNDIDSAVVALNTIIKDDINTILGGTPASLITVFV